MGREKRFFRPHFIERDSRHVAFNDVSMSVPPLPTISRNSGLQPAPITKHATL